MRGPDTREYLVRFPSPSPYVEDTAYARVYEPFDAPVEEPLPTLVYGTGLAMACDSIEYWTEVEYVGRELAPGGIASSCRSRRGTAGARFPARTRANRTSPGCP